MVTQSLICKNEYRDSVFLMRLSKQLQDLKGVQKASAIMATCTNKELLRKANMFTDEIIGASSNDLIIVVEAVSADKTCKALLKARDMLAREEERRLDYTEVHYRTLDYAVRAEPEFNLVLISVPGEFAALEAERALKAGKHVMIFSDGVSLEDEVRLKCFGRKKGLLVMGPDCGTAILGGIGLGFANVVKRGPIGLISASGTGAQEVMSIIDVNLGISQVIGTGGRDLSREVGGITMLMGLQTLAADPETETIVLISKPPSHDIAKKVLKAARKVGKPVVVNFLGGNPKLIEEADLTYAFTLEDAAVKAIALQKREEPRSILFSSDEAEIRKIATREYLKLQPHQNYIRGIYSGGTLCSEAMLIVKDSVGDVYSNVPLKSNFKLADSNHSKKHTFVDMGEDEFTANIGKPHPMLYHDLRQKRILQEASDPETAVLLLDVVLGHGAHEDPATPLTQTLQAAKEIAEREGRYLSVVASVCGTSHDPQNLRIQTKKLKQAQVIVMPSNAQASRMAALISTRGEAWSNLVER